MANQQNQDGGKGTQGQRPAPATKGNGQQTRKQREDAIRSSRQTAKQRYDKNQREMRIIRIAAAVLLVVLIGGIGYGIFQWAGDRENNASPEKTVADYTYTGSQHSAEPQVYSETPPVGGVHNSVWQNCGFYPQELNNENAVHSLEHGAVWITYDPALPQADIDKLKNIAEEQDYILVSPFAGLPSPVVASSWNHQIELDGVDDPDLLRFINNYKQGADTPEPGALCSNGTSATKVS